ncbi:TetR/AcrR family transcriptional regulator [Actinocatenispora rupis]|uniref:TetR family transcriptional regulator n=2 Tax=Actinocatenispora rupis TaxID=519421 RepID=A0A8J3JGP7_9ACTN|nr:TetR family transcriptional regulator [Actinocatenispora rupis]
MRTYERSGPAGFTMTAVTQASGVSVGSLYHHFGSFDGLAATLYAECMDDLLAAVVAALGRTRTARTGIAAAVTGYLDWAGANRARAHLIHASAYAAFLPEHAARIAAVKAPRLAAVDAWLRPYVAAGQIVDLPVPLLEMLVIGPAAEATRRWLAGAPGVDLDDARRVLPDRVWQSVRGPAG